MADKEAESSAVISPIIIGVVIAIIPAALGYIFSSFDSLRRERLEFTNNQIEKLYGPLYALTQASDVAWKEFVASNWPGNPETRRYFFDRHPPPTVGETAQWRHWMQTVFQPLNLRTESIIVDNSQLIVGNQLPKTFQLLIAQTEAYKSVISSWSEADKSIPTKYIQSDCNTVSGINYPSEIDECVSKTYVNLKQQQEKLQDVWNGYSWHGYSLPDLKPESICEQSDSQPQKARSNDSSNSDYNVNTSTADSRRQSCL
jgi:hypothetical protein